MCVCVYVCVCMCACTCMHVCAFVCACMHTCAYVSGQDVYTDCGDNMAEKGRQEASKAFPKSALY